MRMQRIRIHYTQHSGVPSRQRSRSLRRARKYHRTVEYIGFSYTVGDVRSPRFVVYIDRRAFLQYLAVFHYDYGIAHCQGFFGEKSVKQIKLKNFLVDPNTGDPDFSIANND